MWLGTGWNAAQCLPEGAEPAVAIFCCHTSPASRIWHHTQWVVLPCILYPGPPIQ